MPIGGGPADLEHVARGAGRTAVGGARPRLRPSCFAGMSAESGLARDQSNTPRSPSLSSSSRWQCSHALAACQPPRRRHQGTTPGWPTPTGSARHSAPVSRMDSIPSRAARSETRSWSPSASRAVTGAWSPPTAWRSAVRCSSPKFSGPTAFGTRCLTRAPGHPARPYGGGMGLQSCVSSLQILELNRTIDSMLGLCFTPDDGRRGLSGGVCSSDLGGFLLPDRWCCGEASSAPPARVNDPSAVCGEMSI